MSKRSSGGTVNVSGYTRSNGTYVAGYTRAAPSSSRSAAPSSYSSRGSSSGIVHVSGYTRSNGTYVEGYTRAAPSSSRGSSSNSSGRVQVSGYTRSDGTVVSGYTRSAPSSRTGVSSGPPGGASSQSISNTSTSSGVRCYVDNAYNRKWGRVGKPLGSHPVNSSGERLYVDNAHNRRCGRAGKPIPRKYAKQQELQELEMVENLRRKLNFLEVADEDLPAYQSALGRMEREEVEANWEEEGIDLNSPFSHTIQDQIIPHNELKVEKEIGRGGFGKVYACLWHGKPVAFKEFLYQSMTKKRQEQFEKEIKLLAGLHHPNIVRMFGAVVERGKIGIVMEYMKRSLFEALFYDEEEFSDAKKKQIISQLAIALCYLHKHEPQIAHCDIKGGNVLLDRKDNAKLCDFGLSAIKSATEASRSSVAAPPAQGTPRYSAPEVLRGEMLTMSQLLMADIYSLAIVVFEVVVEKEAFEDLSIRQLVANVGHGNLHPTSGEVELPQPLLDLLNTSWDGSASKRPTAEKFKEKWDEIGNLLTV